MKPSRWETFIACAILLALAILILAAVMARGQTARLTSDVDKSLRGFPPVPPGIYVPPQPSIAVIWTTNVEPILVRVTISSNVIPRWVWTDQGITYTNCGTPLSSNVISVVTNDVTKP